MPSRRETTQSIESILNAIKSSGIIFDWLDLIAYNPYQIPPLIANVTSKLIGNVNFTSISTTEKLNLDLYYTRIYSVVMKYGVVTFLLDGILLEESYRPI